MTLPTWPTDVPSTPPRAGFQATSNIAPIANEMEGGNLRQRRRPGDNVSPLQQTLSMSPAQFDIFKAFVEDDLFLGTARFTMPIYNGTGYDTKTVQFDGSAGPPYTWTQPGRKIIVSMKLRVYNNG